MAVRRHPFDLFDEMDRMLTATRRWAPEGTDEGGPTALSNGGRGVAGTHVSVEANDEGYVIIADMPGFETSDIDLRFEDGFLTIDATHTVEDAVEGESAYGAAARSRSMHESVRVPGEIREDEITATYRNGVLEVHVPTLDEDDADESGRRIDVE